MNGSSTVLTDQSVRNVETNNPNELAGDVIHFNDAYYILATSSLADDRTRVLKSGDAFAVFDRYGDIHPVGLGEQGIYCNGTRFVSRLEFRLAGKRPLLLSSSITKDNDRLAVDMTNPDLFLGKQEISRGSVHIFRSIFLRDGICYERFKIANYALSDVDLKLSFTFSCDYADIFEVRGLARHRRGKQRSTEMLEREVKWGYEGLDDVARMTRFISDPSPTTIKANEMSYDLHIESKGQAIILLYIACDEGVHARPLVAYEEMVKTRIPAIAGCNGTQGLQITSSNAQFNEWMQHSISDLKMMLTSTKDGLYPYAGVPWYCTVFGRDGIITALETLWINPDIARGVLSFLAATQAQNADSEMDAEPGKIIHEMRGGEMAALHEVPFGRYYGSVDATPLFIVLAGAYYERTGDIDLISKLWESIERALYWIDTYGDIDGDGFVEYKSHSKTGLFNQGWKDSQDSVFHADGRLATPPIALCEVQGYVYAAKRAAAMLAEALGHMEKGRQLRAAALKLAHRFEEAFWDESLSTYVLALDGDKKPCRVSTSNAGHCLFSKIATQARANQIAAQLMNSSFFSGWGIRTVGREEPRYNPMSYHNGSIWPHDNALITYGLSLYRIKEPVIKVMTGLFDASLFFDFYRLPELFCGFDRQMGQGPTQYPVACSPQVWATASLFLLLQACLGLWINVPRKKVYFFYPILPAWLNTLFIENLRVGKACIDLSFQRHANTVGINVVRRSGEIEIVTVK